MSAKENDKDRKSSSDQSKAKSRGATKTVTDQNAATEPPHEEPPAGEQTTGVVIRKPPGFSR